MRVRERERQKNGKVRTHMTIQIVKFSESARLVAWLKSINLVWVVARERERQKEDFTSLTVNKCNFVRVLERWRGNIMLKL